MRATFDAAAASMDEVADCIRRVKARSGYLLDPHTACGVIAAERLSMMTPTPRVVLATASPAKFPDAMAAISGDRPALPPRLASLLTDPERMTVLPNDLAAVERFVADSAKTGAEPRKGADA
jgi:threonine synthase